MVVLGLAFVVLLLLGFPIAFVLAGIGIVHLLLIDNPAYFQVITQRMFSAVNQFSLLAIPFYMLAGELMNKGGITTKLINLAREMVGFLRGGLAYVNIMVGVFLAAIVGSANVEAAIRSSILVPEMEKDGYDRDFAAAITASSSIIGPIIPPSIIFILYGVMSGTSISALFLGGIIPGLLIALAQMIMVYFYAKKKNYPVYRQGIDWRQLFKSLLEAIPALLVPIVIIGGVLTGVFTPTEAGAIATLIAFVAGTVIYRTLRIQEIPKLLLNTGIMTASIMILLSMGNIMAYTLAIEKVPQTIVNFLSGLTDNSLLVLILIVVFLLIIGAVMEEFAAMVILIPVMLPIVEQFSFDPIHFGIVFSVAMAIGLITPPVGVTLFITSNITRVPFEQLSKAIIPFLLATIAVLFLIALFPELVTFLPDMMMEN